MLRVCPLGTEIDCNHPLLSIRKGLLGSSVTKVDCDMITIMLMVLRRVIFRPPGRKWIATNQCGDWLRHPFLRAGAPWFCVSGRAFALFCCWLWL